MTRSHIALAVLLSAPIALYGAVILPREIPQDFGEPTSPAAFLPTTVGSKWVYRHVATYRYRPIERFEVVELVTDVADRGGERVVTVRQLQGDSRHKLNEWSASEAGLRWRSIPDPLHDYWKYQREQPGEWYPGLPARVVPGETWTQDSPSNSSRVTYTIAEWEPVRVPAGRYRALRIDFVITDYERTTNKSQATLKGSVWEVPGIGHVKLLLTMVVIPFHLTHDLVSFTPGR